VLTKNLETSELRKAEHLSPEALLQEALPAAVSIKYECHQLLRHRKISVLGHVFPAKDFAGKNIKKGNYSAPKPCAGGVAQWFW